MILEAIVHVISSEPDRCNMSAAPDPSVVARLAALEKDLRDLRARMAALERRVGTAGEHADDAATVQKKVSYDWQS